MSLYLEANGINFDMVKEQLKSNKIKGIEVKEEDKDEIGVKCGEDFIWIMRGCVFKEGLGIKRFGANSIENIIDLLEGHYNISFISEEDLNICHMG